MNTRRIIGIDPGSQNTGFGLIDVQGSTLKCVAFGEIVTKSGNELTKRLQHIYSSLLQIINEHKPDEAAIEQIFLRHNPKSAFILGHARGAAMVALATLPISEYAARTIKQSIVGNGAAEKTQIQFMVQRLLRLENKLPHNAADALAIAICHYLHRRIRI